MATGEGERGVTDGGTAPPQQDGFVLQQEQYHGDSRRRWFRCVLFHFLVVVKEGMEIAFFIFIMEGSGAVLATSQLLLFLSFSRPGKKGINMLLLVWMAD